jgi:hypothetical protein
MKATAPRIGRFVLHAFLWLPVGFAIWYFTVPLHSAIAGRMAWLLMAIMNGGLVSSVEQPAAHLIFVTTLQVQAAGGPALVTPEVDPLLYTYGLAFFLALALASRAPWRRILAGVAMLLPFQAFSIAFDCLAQVAFRMGPDVSAAAGFAGWQVEAVALGYQVGTLMLPTLMPVIVWAVVSPAFFAYMRSIESTKGDIGDEGIASRH